MKIQTNGLVLIALVLFASACQQKAPVKRTAEWVKVTRVNAFHLYYIQS